MLFSFVSAITVALALSTSVTATFVDACPPNTLALPDRGVCACRGKNGVKPYNPGCGADLKFMGWFPWCDTHCPPTPSHKPKAKRDETYVLEDGLIAPCPRGSMSCPISAPVESQTNGRRTRGHKHIASPTTLTGEYECVDPLYDIDNCGGCAATGAGESCADVKGVKSTACVKGRCHVFSCGPEYTMVAAIEGVESSRKCVPNSDL